MQVTASNRSLFILSWLKSDVLQAFFIYRIWHGRNLWCEIPDFKPRRWHLAVQRLEPTNPHAELRRKFQKVEEAIRLTTDPFLLNAMFRDRRNVPYEEKKTTDALSMASLGLS
ncbi:hypothetical protein LSM04_000951 [Trypanosoma melophagium]|uniref:uncharacterized protein n=1 Tax=Trypanosoma melophagium TaxID=715481 RepID=UPI00351A86EA|nr:hypothetical protein LSM04_000951 [Trypanosoma melophagium]